MPKSAVEEMVSVPHSLQLTERKMLDVRGVTEIRSSDEEHILFETALGNLLISGKDLHVKSLLPEKNEAHVEGDIQSLMYSKGKTKHLRRLGDIFR